MTAFAPTHSPRSNARTVRKLLLGTAAALCVCLLAAPVAGAVVEEVGAGASVGVQPRAALSVNAGGGASEFSNPEGNPIVPAANTFVVYWDPTDAYHPEWERLIDTFMHNVGDVSGHTDTVFSVDTQYTDSRNEGASFDTVFRGAYTDTHAYPTGACKDPDAPARALTCLTDAQIREQLQSFISAHSLPTGLSDIYYILTPPGVTLCLEVAAAHCSDYVRPSRTKFKTTYEGKTVEFPQEVFSNDFHEYTVLSSGQRIEISKQELETFNSESYKNSFCSYHSAINPGGSREGSASTIVYAAIPWVAGSAGERAIFNREQIDWGYECQDGGIVPTGKGGALTREHPKEEKEAETNTFLEATVEEKLALLENKERETPHLQEPEQVGLGEDGMYDYGLADVEVNQISLQQQDVVTDPLLNAWQAPSTHLEASDECRNDFLTASMSGSATAQEETNAGTLSNQTYGGVPYYLNDAFNLAADKLSAYGVPCIAGISLAPSFTTPNPVAAGETVGFDGMESDVTLDEGTRYEAGKAEPSYAHYSWTIRRVGATNNEAEFGGYAPGAPVCETPWVKPCAASEYYSFSKPGTYEVTLRIRDVGGNEASVTHDVEVLGSSEAGSGAGNGTGGSSGAGGSSNGSTASSPLAAPVARTAVVSRSLKEALNNGLAVLYNVNEQVAGHFEVLLNAKLARRLGIAGSPALDLPTGAEAQTVIARALLVTLKGGTSALHIKFSKRTAKRLAKLHKVSLELRLIVHNSALHPGAATVTTVVTLGPPKQAKTHR